MLEGYSEKSRNDAKGESVSNIDKSKMMPARRPFLARGSKVKRCPACQLAISFCACQDYKQVQSIADFWLLMHHDEFYKPSNTGQLILKTFPQSGCSEWARLQMAESFELLLQRRQHNACLVFPIESDYVHREVTDLETLGDTPLFIILDGTWRQARRMFRHSPYLAQLPVFQPQVERGSHYQLRSSGPEHHLCTAEIAVAVLEQLGDETAAAALAHNFALFNQRYAASKGRFLPDNVS
ncbi:tRNA-uridine aminocarboxypropyltransferase [Nitrincola tapanii]|uniref:tRNA-uridine aminocarboxypropyltransferase n=1 Tax=Nitrincola tapanii TaxID=1708751 RepID=A0A5A9W146_9GAMM|nr:DTW domain-containing protein [Nitrincola tapanii]KAA0874510.1 DTW domain-containing protein [Nitrincola tapanii]